MKKGISSRLLFSNITRLGQVNNREFLIPSIAFITILITATPSIVYAQGNPFQIGPNANPFEVGGGYSPGESQSNTTLQIRSDTDWSGTYGDSTGSTTVDGHGNKDLSFSCSNTYSAFFQKKGEGPGFLTLNIVQPFNYTLTKFQEITKHGVPLAVGTSLNLTKQITDLLDPIDFDMYPQTNTSGNALDTGQPLNTTLRVMITDPNGSIILSNDTAAQYYHFSPTVYPPIKTHVAGKYTFSIRNLGSNPTDLRITYGSLPSQTTVTTHNVTNTRTTTAQFGTVSVSGSC